MAATADDIPPLISPDQVAERLGTSRRHLTRLVHERRIPFVKVGWLLRFDAEEITAWIDQHRSAGR